MNPQRIQLSRARGFRLPAGVVSVARGTRWGNPFRIVARGKGGPWEVHYKLGPRDTSSWQSDHEHYADARVAAVGMFESSLNDGYLLITPDDVQEHLAGRSLACWCPLDDLPCHADVLIDTAARNGDGENS